jgi:hypothetical protein
MIKVALTPKTWSHAERLSKRGGENMFHKGKDTPSGSRVEKTKEQQANLQKPIIFQNAITASSMSSRFKPITSTPSVNHTQSVGRDVHHKDTPTDVTTEAAEAADAQSVSTDFSFSSTDDHTLLPDVDMPTPMSDTEKEVAHPLYTVHEPIIEVPVLIARTDIQVDLVSHVDIPHSVLSVTDIRWRVHPLNSRLLLPTNELIVNGAFTAYIQYQTAGAPSELRTASTNLTWRKAQTVTFLYPPIVPAHREFKMYTFQGNQSRDLTTHREQVDLNFEKPFSRLRLSRIVSTEQIQSDGNTSHIRLHVSAALSIHLFQVQLINCPLKS